MWDKIKFNLFDNVGVKYKWDKNCKNVNFLIKNNKKLGSKIKNCFLEKISKDTLLEVKNNYLSLKNIVDVLKLQEPGSDITLLDKVPLYLNFIFDENIMEVELRNKDGIHLRSKKYYEKKFERLKIWEKYQVMYNGELWRIGVPKKYLNDKNNWDAHLSKTKVLGLINYKDEKELVVFYKKNKNPLKFEIDFDNSLNYKVLLKSNEMLQAIFDEKLEEIKHSKKEVFTFKLNKRSTEYQYMSEYDNKKFIHKFIDYLIHSLKVNNYVVGHSITADIKVIDMFERIKVNTTYTTIKRN